jgi:hypothetical protein
VYVLGIPVFEPGANAIGGKKEQGTDFYRLVRALARVRLYRSKRLLAACSFFGRKCGKKTAYKPIPCRGYFELFLERRVLPVRRQK